MILDFELLCIQCLICKVKNMTYIAHIALRGTAKSANTTIYNVKPMLAMHIATKKSDVQRSFYVKKW